MNVSKELERFIENNIDLIEQNTKESWEQVYSLLHTSTFDYALVGMFSQLFIHLGCNPLLYLDGVPAHFLYLADIPYKQKITLPSNITYIGAQAFSNCALDQIVIPVSCVSIEDWAFDNNFTTIIYQGTKEQWYSIEKESDWNSIDGVQKVECIDGVINYDVE